MTTAPTEKPTPAYKRVQAPTESLDGIACISMITGKPIADILKVAIQKFKLCPTNGPYFFNDARIKILLATYGFLAGDYREAKTSNDFADLSLLWIETDPEMEVGKVVLFHRMKNVGGDPKQNFAYIVDPAAQTDPSLCIRTDLAALNLNWFIAVEPMTKPAK